MSRNIADGEKEDLELHVELCAERYHRLEEKFNGVEERLDSLHHDFSAFKAISDRNFSELKNLIGESKDKRFSVMVTTSGTIIVALLGMLGYIITHMPK
jgi:predicted  nucleic acid-binding Zn-ribbon protein